MKSPLHRQVSYIKQTHVFHSQTLAADRSEVLCSRIQVTQRWIIKINEQNVKSLNLIRACKMLLCNIFNACACASDRGKVKRWQSCSHGCEQDHSAYLTTIFPRILGFTSCMSSSITVTSGKGRAHILYAEAVYHPRAHLNSNILNTLQGNTSSCSVLSTSVLFCLL